MDRSCNVNQGLLYLRRGKSHVKCLPKILLKIQKFRVNKSVELNMKTKLRGHQGRNDSKTKKKNK